MSRTHLLIVHPDASHSAMLASMLRPLGRDIDEVADDPAAVRRLGQGVAALVARADPADPDALELVVYARRKHPEVPVILLFSAPHPGRTQEALRLGAAAVLPSPPTATELRAAVVRGLERRASPPADSGPDVLLPRGWGYGSDPSAPAPTRPGDGLAAEDGPARGLRGPNRTIDAKDRASIRGEVPAARSPFRGNALPDPSEIRPLKEALEAPEREFILQALMALNWNRQETARALDINRTTLFKKMRKYGLMADERPKKKYGLLTARRSGAGDPRSSFGPAGVPAARP
jgi:DNA-binding NtrC family response regulator